MGKVQSDINQKKVTRRGHRSPLWAPKKNIVQL